MQRPDTQSTSGPRPPADSGKDFLLDQLALAVRLSRTHSRLPLQEAHGIRFYELFEARTKSQSIVRELGEYVCEYSGIYDELGIAISDREELHLETLADVNPGFQIAADALHKLAKAQSTDSPVTYTNEVFTISNQDIPKLALIDGLTSSLALTGETVSQDREKEIADKIPLAVRFYHVIATIKQYASLNKPIPQGPGLKLNNNLYEILLACDKHTIPIETLIVGAPLKEVGKNILRERIIGQIQEINGLNLNIAVGLASEKGTSKDDRDAKDTMHRIRLDEGYVPLGIDWKSSPHQVSENRSGKPHELSSAVFMIGRSTYQIDIACISRTNKEIKLRACLSEVIGSKRSGIERILHFNFNPQEKHYTREILKTVVSSAISSYGN